MDERIAYALACGDVRNRSPFSSSCVRSNIKLRHIGNCMKADPSYGEGIAKALGISLSEVKK